MSKDIDFNTYCKGNSLIAFPCDYTVVDLETTGLDPNYDEIIEIAAVRVINNLPSDTFSALVKPNKNVSEFITSLTGITNEMLSTAEKIEDVLKPFINFVGSDIIVGHNVNFDINFIHQNAVKCFDKAFSNDFVDTLRLSRKYVKDVENHRLQTLVKHFNVPTDGAHRSLADCYSTQRLFEILCKIHAGTEKNALDSLNLNNAEMYKNKSIFVNGNFKTLSKDTLLDLFNRLNATWMDIFYANKTDYFIMSDHSYRNYVSGDYSQKMEKANRLQSEGKLKVMSESDFLSSLGISPTGEKHSTGGSIKISELSTDVKDFNAEHPLYGKNAYLPELLNEWRAKTLCKWFLTVAAVSEAL